MNYENIRLDKSMYKAEGGFSAQLERLDPSHKYSGTDLAGLDAFQRQLKRFDIKVSGAGSDVISKFFSTAEGAALFPEYISRAVAQGAGDASVVDSIIASRTNIHSMDYRSITTALTGADMTDEIAEGAVIPETAITLNDSLIKLKKRGRVLSASYEAIKYQRTDVFTVALKQVGVHIAKAQLRDAVKMLVSGDGSIPAAKVINAAGSTVTYSDLLNLWKAFEDFEMNVMLASPDMALQIMKLSEFQSALKDDFATTGKYVTPLGAKFIKTSAVPAKTVIALDKRFALEMVTCGGVQVEYDKLIDTQLERAAITSVYGFSKLFPDAVRVLKCS